MSAATTARSDVALARFAERVGVHGPVTVVGGRTRWEVGGPVDPRARDVSPPTGVGEFIPAEMTVRVNAGTTVAELQAVVGEAGQRVVMAGPAGSTVGGTLAVGHSGLDRLGAGPLREVLLEATYISAEGRVVRVGGPTVKNVSGYDLCRVLVGSLGTIGFLGEVIMRTTPQPETSGWWSGSGEPTEIRAQLHWPMSVLWDGTTTWVQLAGYEADVSAESAILEREGLRSVKGPPTLPPHRWSLAPSELTGHDFGGRFVAEIGVGTVHAERPAPHRPADAVLTRLHRRLRATFDPTGRLNPGRTVPGVDPGEPDASSDQRQSSEPESTRPEPTRPEPTQPEPTQPESRGPESS